MWINRKDYERQVAYCKRIEKELLNESKVPQHPVIVGKYFFAENAIGINCTQPWGIYRTDLQITGKRGSFVFAVNNKEDAQSLVDYFDKKFEELLERRQRTIQLKDKENISSE